MTKETPLVVGFKNFDLIEPIQQVLLEVGYENPFPIQIRVIPAILAGRDVLGQAQTGTGKTAAFALPLLSKLDLKRAEPQVLVLTPTRELAIQVAEAFQKYATHLKGFHVLPVYGGQEYGGQLRSLSRGVHVVVGTPGRVMDHITRGTLKLDTLRCLVLDEADEMLQIGFKEDVEWILERIPDDRQIALFSATIPTLIRELSKKYLKNPEEIFIRTKTSTVETTRQRYWLVSGMNKLDALTRILEAEPSDGVLIFVRTRLATQELAEKLAARGFAASGLSGEMAQSQRERTIELFKRGKLNIIVATDVAARGLDVERISHVINYDMPYDTEAYIHRIGRTGRAGRSGEAILFVSPREQRMLKTIERATRQSIAQMGLPPTEAINDKRIVAFKQKITQTLGAGDLQLFRDLVEQYSQEFTVPHLEIAAALGRLFQGNVPLLLSAKPSKTAPGEGENQSNEPRPPRRERQECPCEEGKTRYRIEVGRFHGVQPGNIVGAIAGETGMNSKNIGKIKLYAEFSTVDLPNDMPVKLLKKLEKIWVSGQQLRIKPDEGRDAMPGNRSRRSFNGGSRGSESKQRKVFGNYEPRKPGKPKPYHLREPAARVVKTRSESGTSPYGGSPMKRPPKPTGD